MAGHAVGAALSLAKKLYAAIQTVPQLRRQCANLEEVVLSLEAVIEDLANAEDDPNVQDLLGKLQDALQEGLDIVQQGEGKGLHDWARLVFQGENVARKLAAVSGRIELGLTSLLPGMKGQMGKINKDVAEVNAQLRELKEQLNRIAEAIDENRAEISDRVRKVAERGASSIGAQHNEERIIELLAGSSMGTVSMVGLEKEWKNFRSEAMLGPDQKQVWLSDADMLIEDIMFRHLLDMEKLLKATEKTEQESMRLKEESKMAAKNAAENEKLRRSLAQVSNELKAATESPGTSQEALKDANVEINRGMPAHILERMLNELHAKAGLAKESTKSDHEKADHLYPRSFTCRICSCTLEDPVVVETGYSFCQKCLEQHLQSDTPTCPITRRPMNTSIVIKDIDLQLAITNWWEWLSDWIGRERALLSSLRPSDPPRSNTSSPRHERHINGLVDEDASSAVDAEVTKDHDVVSALSNLSLDDGLNAKVAIGAAQLTNLLQAHPQKWKQMCGAQAIKPLVRILRMKGQVRLFGITALEAMMAVAVREAYENNNEEAEKACGEIIDEARDSLLELLSDESPAVRAKAAETIGHCLEVQTVAVLLAKQERPGLITGLMHLSFAEDLHEMMHGVHGPATIESVRGIGRRVLCQLARVVVTNQAQSAKPATDPAREDVVDCLWKLVHDPFTTIEALHMLTRLARGGASGLSAPSVAEGAHARTALLTYLLGQAESNKPLRLPLAEFLSGLAATTSKPGDLLETGGVDKLLRLLQVSMKEIEAEPGVAEGWACLSFLVDVLATTSMGEGEGEEETQVRSAVERRDLSVATLLELLKLTIQQFVPRARFFDLSSSLQDSVQTFQSSALRCVGLLSVSEPFSRYFIEEGGVELISQVLEAVRSAGLRTRDCAKALAGLMVACPVKAEAALKNSVALLGLCKILDGGKGDERLAALDVLKWVESTTSVAENLEPAWLCPVGEESAKCRAAGAKLFDKLSSSWGDRDTDAISAALDFLADAHKRGLRGGPAAHSVLQAVKTLTTNVQNCTALLGDEHGVDVLVQVAKRLKIPTAQIMMQICERIPDTAAADSRFVAALVSLLDDPDARSLAAVALDELASSAASLGGLAGGRNEHVTVLLKAVPLARAEDKVVLVRVLWRLCKAIGAAVAEAVVSGEGVKIMFTAAGTLEASGRTGDAVACLVAIYNLKVPSTDLGRDIVAAGATTFLVNLLEASVDRSVEDRTVRYAMYFLGCAADADPDACIDAGLVRALGTYLEITKGKEQCTLVGIELIAALVSSERAKTAVVKTSAAAHCADLMKGGKRCRAKAPNSPCEGVCVAEATRLTEELARPRSKSSWRGTLGRVSSTS